MYLSYASKLQRLVFFCHHDLSSIDFCTSLELTEETQQIDLGSCLVPFYPLSTDLLKVPPWIEPIRCSEGRGKITPHNQDCSMLLLGMACREREKVGVCVREGDRQTEKRRAMTTSAHGHLPSLGSAMLRGSAFCLCQISHNRVYARLRISPDCL